MRPPPIVTMCNKKGPDQRRYNDPTHDDVAAVFVASDGAPPLERDIVIYPKNATPRNIGYMSSNIDPMVYPLLFPHGELSWVHGMNITLRRAPGSEIH